MLLAAALAFIPLAIIAPNTIFKVVAAVIGVVGALVALGVIPSKAKKNIPAAGIFGAVSLYLIISLLVGLIGGIFAGGSSGPDGSKKRKALDWYYSSSTTTYENYYETLEEKDEVWFKFEPTESKTYRIFVTGMSGSYTLQLLEKNGKDVIAEVSGGGSGETVIGKAAYSYSATTPVITAYLEADAKYYIKLTQDEYIYDCTFALNITDPVPQGAESSNPYALTLDQNHEGAYGNHLNYEYRDVWFSYTPDVTGGYTFAVYGLDNNMSAYLYDSSMNQLEYSDYDYPDDPYSKNHEITYYLTANQTYYYKLTSDSSYSNDRRFSVSFTKVPMGASEEAAYPLTFGENSFESFESLENNYYVWFKFSPETSAYYSFAQVGGSGTYAMEVYDESGYTPYSSGGYYQLYSGSSYYVKLYDIYSKDVFGIKVDTAKGLSINNAIEIEEDVALHTGYISGMNSNYEMWFQFTASEEGYYRFTATDAYSYYLYFYQTTDSGGSNPYSDPLDVYLVADQTVYIRLYFYSSYDDDFTIKAYKLAQGESSYTAYPISYTGAESQTYDILTNGANTIWFSYYSQSGYNYYRFVPTGMSENANYYINVTDEYGNYASSYGSGYFYLASGTYYIQIVFNSGTDDTFGISVDNYTASSFSNAANLYEDTKLLTGYSTGIHSSNKMYFKFVPSKSAYYMFDAIDANYHYLRLYDANQYQLTYTTSGDYVLSYTLTAGETYYLEVQFNGNSYPDSSFYLYARPYYEGEIRESAIEIEVGENEIADRKSLEMGKSYVWFTFVSETSGYYYISVYGTADTYSYALYRNSETYAQGTNYGTYYWMPAGSTYYLYVSGVTDTDSIGVKIGSEQGYDYPSAVPLYEDSKIYTGYTSSFHGSYMYFEFTPAESKMYEFYTDNGWYNYFYLHDNFGNLLAEASHNSSNINQTSLTYELTANTTYYLLVSTSDAEFRLVAREPVAGSYHNPIEVEVGDSVEAVITTGGQYVYCAFTATESAYYTFYSSGNWDTYGYLYNSDFTQLSSNDDGAGDGNFLINYYVEAGTTVYVAGRMYNSGNTGSFYIYVTQS